MDYKSQLILAASRRELFELDAAILKDDDNGKSGTGMVFWMNGHTLCGEGRTVRL